MNKIIFRSGNWTVDKIDGLLALDLLKEDPGMCVSIISEHFIGTAYKKSSLIGDVDTEEVLVIDFEGVDCFTFLDYVEALRLSKSFIEFKGNLIRIRYKDGVIAFDSRNHFFTDWITNNYNTVENITDRIKIVDVRRVTKTLNVRNDGTYLIPGIPPVKREICYIPSSMLKKGAEGLLQTGDYIGIYSEEPGLDVSHVGIFIRDTDSTIFRHASSAVEHMKVVDQDFSSYINNKPGIIVLRPKKPG